MIKMIKWEYLLQLVSAKKMDKTVQSLVKKSILDREHDLQLDHEEGESISPFNLASLFGFLGEGLGISSSTNKEDNVKKYAI